MTGWAASEPTFTALCDGPHELWELIDNHLAAARELTAVQELSTQETAVG